MANIGEKLGTTHTQDYVLLGFLALGGYVLYNVFSGVKTLGKGIAAAGAEVADIGAQTGEFFDTMQDPSAQTWAQWYDPTQRSVFVYVLTFPDGNHHLVWGHDVQADGTFTFSNGLYRIGTDKTGGLRAYKYDPSVGDNHP